jgi:hypothetical protein
LQRPTVRLWHWGVLPPRSLHPCVRVRRAARRPGSRTRRRRRRRFTARRRPHLHTRSAQVTGRSPDHITTCALSPTFGQQQSGATPTTGTHRRDARSAPGLDGAARRGNALPTSHLHQKAWHEGQHAQSPALTNTARKPALSPCPARRRQRPRARAAQGLPPSRCGTPTAPRPSTRHGPTSARLDVTATQAKPRRGKEKDAVVLTRGRRCRRGRLVDGVALLLRRGSRPLGDAGVHADAFLPRLVVAVRACALQVPGSSSSRRGATARASLRRDAFPPPTAWRGSGAPAFSFLPGHTAEQWWTKTPMGVVGLAFPSNCLLPLLKPRRGTSWRKSPWCPWHRRRAGQVAHLGCARGALDARGRGQSCPSPFSPAASRPARVEPRRACQPGCPAAPRLARWSGWTGGAPGRLGLTDAVGLAERGEEDKR